MINYIEKVDQPTDWVYSLVITEKGNGKIRLCIDPKELNKGLKRERVNLFQYSHMLPTKVLHAAQLSGAKFFTKMDVSAGFHQIKLINSLMTTFNTPYGSYKYLRLPMGIYSAPEVSHKKMILIEGLEGVTVYIDDILAFKSTSIKEG